MKARDFLNVVCAILWLPAAAGAPVISAVSGGPNEPSTPTDELAFAADVSLTDLLHGIAGTGGDWNANGSSPDGLNDGHPGGDADQAGSAALGGAAWARHGNGGSFRVFDLGAGPDGRGHDITGIQSIAAWQGAGFANQRYEVRVRFVGAGDFEPLPLVEVDYQLFSARLTEGGSTRVRVTDDTGVLAGGVEAIRFDILGTTSNPAGGTVFREIDVFGTRTAGSADDVPPVAVSLSPADNAVNVPVGMPLAVTFHEDISIGAGSITIRNLGSGVETVLALPDPRVSATGRVLSIFPGQDLGPAAHYAIRIDAEAVEDTSGNPFVGIADDVTWDFTTAESIAMEHSLVELNHAGDTSGGDLIDGMAAVASGWNLGNGAHPDKLNDGLHGRTFAVAGNTVDGGWTTVGATAEYELGAGPNGTGHDIFSIQSIAAWVNVGFGNQAWTVEVRPVGGTYATLTTVDYQPLSGGGATRVVVNGPGPVLATGIRSIRFTANSVNNGANGGAFVWREIDVFGQPSGPAGPPDETPPAIITFKPVDGAQTVVPGSPLVVTFSENIAAGAGFIRLRNLDDAAEIAIPVGDSQVSLSGATLTIRPSPKLSPFTRYAVRIDPGTVRDLSGNSFDGIADDSTWNFATVAAPLRIMPLGDSITAGYTDNPVWNVPYWYGYRSGLYHRLQSAGYNFVFVGQSPELPNHFGTGAPPVDLAALGGNAHNGYGGQTAAFLNANILNWLAADEPDVILLKIGTNAQDRPGLDALVNTIVTARPGLHLIVARIMPKYNYEQGIHDYNRWIEDMLVPKYRALGKNVTSVDQYANFLIDPADPASIDRSLFSNGINHPDNLGYDKMAQTWFEGIEGLGLGGVTFGAWIADPAFGIDSGERGFLDDPDGDGLPNGVEAWLGIHPGQRNQAIADFSKDGITMTFTHPFNGKPPVDLVASYQWSPGLNRWYEADGIDGPPEGIRVTCDSSHTGSIATVIFTPSGPADRLFLRLVVVQR